MGRPMFCDGNGWTAVPSPAEAAPSLLFHTNRHTRKPRPLLLLLILKLVEKKDAYWILIDYILLFCVTHILILSIIY